MTERYISIQSKANNLSAIVHEPAADAANGCSDTGVLIIVGGPQYRVGSHRQFVKLSRALAAQGIASMRLDTSGMGDSSGTAAPFYQQTADIEQAITCFFQQCPQLKHLVLWGLCDAASAILIKLNRPDPRISGIVLLNPWVRQTHSYAKAQLKHYYLQRLTSKVFWHKVLRGGLALRQSLLDLISTFRNSRKSQTTQQALAVAMPDTKLITEQNYVELMLSGWQTFNGRTLIITSGNDLTAQEFLSLCQSNSLWQQQLNSSQHQHCSEANHTFSTEQWRQQVEQQTISFIVSIS